MTTKQNGIWSTVEADAWSRDFDYSNYMSLHKRMSCSGKMLSETAYRALCNVLHNEMVTDYEKTTVPTGG